MVKVRDFPSCGFISSGDPPGAYFKFSSLRDGHGQLIIVGTLTGSIERYAQTVAGWVGWETARVVEVIVLPTEKPTTRSFVSVILARATIPPIA